MLTFEWEFASDGITAHWKTLLGIVQRVFISLVDRTTTLMCDWWLTAAHVVTGDEPKAFELFFEPQHVWLLVLRASPGTRILCAFLHQTYPMGWFQLVSWY